MSPEIREKVLETIRQLENNLNSQEEIDAKYQEIKNIFSNEMEKLPYKSSNDKKQNKNYRKAQSFSERFLP